MVTKHYLSNELTAPSHFLQFSRTPVKLDYPTATDILEERNTEKEGSFDVMAGTDFISSLRNVPHRNTQLLSPVKDPSPKKANANSSEDNGTSARELRSGISRKTVGRHVAGGRVQCLPELKTKPNKRYSHIKSRTDTNLVDFEQDSKKTADIKKQNSKNRGAIKYNPRRIHSAIVWRSNTDNGSKFQGRAISASTNHAVPRAQKTNTNTTVNQSIGLPTSYYSSGTDGVGYNAGTDTSEAVQQYSYWASYINGRRGLNVHESPAPSQKEPFKLDPVKKKEEEGDGRLQEIHERFTTSEPLKEYNRKTFTSSSGGDLQVQYTARLPTRVTSALVPNPTSDTNYKSSLTDSIDVYKRFSKLQVSNPTDSSTTYVHNGDGIEDAINKRMLFGRNLPKTSIELDRYKSLTERIIQSTYSPSSKDLRNKEASVNEDTAPLNYTSSQESPSNSTLITSNPSKVSENSARCSYSFGKKNHSSETGIKNDVEYDTWRSNYNYIYGYDAAESVAPRISKISNFSASNMDSATTAGVSNRKIDQPSDIISRFLKERSSANDIIDQCLDDRGKSNYVNLKYIQQKTQNYLQPIEKTQTSAYLLPRDKTSERSGLSEDFQNTKENYLKGSPPVSSEELSYPTSKTTENTGLLNDYPSTSYSANYITSWMDGFETGKKNYFTELKNFSLTDSIVLAKSIQNPNRKSRKFSLDDSYPGGRYQSVKNNVSASENSMDTLPPLTKSDFSSMSVPANLNKLGRSLSAKKVRIALEHNRYHFYSPEPPN